ncbi:MAG TPA: creatininase family protein [Fimbriimonas sp.]
MCVRYAESTPEAIDRILASDPVAIVPVGALEWHGDHLPLGTDGILAEAFAERLANLEKGLLLPTYWLPITTLPHRLSLGIRTETFRMWLEDLLQGLVGIGLRRIAIVTGHYAQAHEIELYEAALGTMEDHPGVRVFAAAPLEPLDRFELLDHAGRWETAQLSAIRPELADPSRLPRTIEPKVHGVLGEHPSLGTAAEGSEVIEEALGAWSRWFASSREDLRDWYQNAFDRYQPYVDAYYQGSWQDAIERWWAERG